MLGIIISIFIGIFCGLLLKSSFLLNSVDIFIKLGLCLLLFFVGIDIGNYKNLAKSLRKIKKKVIFLPIITILGSIFGGFITASFLSLSFPETIAISSGMGWYSFSAIELAKIDANLGAIAFLSNVFRELLAILLIPFIAKYLGGYEAISCAGAPAMDSLLPFINRNTPANMAIVSFYSGLIITLVIPILLPFLISIFNLA
ncbi:lysine exporter LysO family protein [Fusobacterium mortiferum]|uniref:lysine exporter LysO family protein n=1 Tax=Fusobacterium mortiferum TaxID=850 RepID=UPI000E452539|nr:lysine exporter LysO family protein [Fusobacterium mortiferum]RGM96390.1 lysine exporter LysO family protein [Fusobacterium mortiferum]